MKTLLPILVFVLLPLPVAAQDSGTWQERPAPPRVRNNAASAQIGASWYLTGTEYYTTFQQQMLERYDGLTETWSQLPSIPLPDATYEWISYRSTAAGFRGKMYLFGGEYKFKLLNQSNYQAYSGTNCDHVWEFDPASSTWTRMRNLPTAWTGWAVPGATRIYLVGGTSRLVGTMFQGRTFDPTGPSGGTYGTIPNFPLPNEYMVGLMGIVNDKLYMLAHDYPDNQLLNWMYEFDLRVGVAWVRKSATLDGVWCQSIGGIACRNRIYVTGDAWYDYRTELYEYNPQTDLWLSRGPGILNGSNCGWHAGFTFGTPEIHGFMSPGPTSRHFKYTPPDFREPSNPAGMAQRIPGGRDLSEGAPVASSSIEFGAWLDNPAGLGVRLEVEIVPAAAPFTGIATVAGPFLSTPGLHVATRTGLTEGAWKWRARAIDTQGSGNVGGWIDFETLAPDFVVDLTAPPPPSRIAPKDQTVDLGKGETDFTWTEVIDAYDVTYDLDVATDPDFQDVTVSHRGLTSTSTGVRLPVGTRPRDYFWRMRTTDLAGNVGSWSPTWHFRAETSDHAAGDARRGCGMSAGPSAWSLVFAALLLLLVKERVRK